MNRLPILLFGWPVLSLVNCSRAAVPEIHALRVPAAELAHLQTALLPHYRIHRPDGTGPFATVMFVSGCSGFEHPRAPNHYQRMVERFRTAGRAVVFVDYVRAHGAAEACRGVLSPQEVGIYVLAAIDYIRQQPFVDSKALDMVGWSLGGGGVLAALAALPEGSPGPVRFAVALYPDCGGLRPWRVPVQTLVVLAGQDIIQPPERCELTTSALVPPTRVVLRTHPQAHHGFDMEELPAELVPGMPALAYNATESNAAWKEIARFLDLSPPRH